MRPNLVQNKLKDHKYQNTKEVFDDFMLIVSNCKTYNTDVNNLVRKMSIQLEDTVRKAWEKKASELASMGKLFKTFSTFLIYYVMRRELIFK